MIHIIVGPTASGKTIVANKIAEILDCPIINADAYQIYKDMNIGTNKILKTDKNYNRYYLLDLISPNETFDVSKYQKVFRNTLDKLIKNNRDVVVVGGNGFYIRASIYDYSFNKEEDDNFDYSKFSNQDLFDKLMDIDEESATKIHLNNRKRLIRALEIYRKNGISKSELICSQKHKYIYPNIKIYFINPPRKDLYELIDNRVNEMIGKGLVNEVEKLINKYNLSSTAKAAIGYKEIICYLEQKISLNDAIELIKKNTRNYAKRQITFFKHQFDCTEYDSYEDLLKEFIKNE